MTDSTTSFDQRMMQRALALAIQGKGYVEPNPMVGCVVTRHGDVLAEGYHQRFGHEHAEVQALSGLSLSQRRGSTIYVTLEPCSHFGKTPPCVDLLIESKPDRVVVGVVDPFPQVSGSGIAKLKMAGIQVDLGVEAQACQRLIAPFAKLNTLGMPWLIAKWAMTMDGRLATFRGDSKWITHEKSRQHAHAIRGTLDAIIVGVGTAISDDPMLTARPAGPRVASRIVVDSQARICTTSQLVQTAREFPTVIVCSSEADSDRIESLRKAGCDVWPMESRDRNQRFVDLLKKLGAKRMTNVLIDGGPRLLGSAFDQQLVDEVHCYIGGKVVGGEPNFVPNAGLGIATMSQAWQTSVLRCEQLDGDIFLSGDLSRSTQQEPAIKR